MKKIFILGAITIMVAGCVAPREYTVRSYAQTYDGYWYVEAAARKKDSSFKTSRDFLMPCAPDSVGSRFMFHPRDVVYKYRQKSR